MIALFVNAPTVRERDARELKYVPLTEWSPPDSDLIKLGYTEPVQNLVVQYQQAVKNGKYVMIVRQDGGDHFAIFTR